MSMDLIKQLAPTVASFLLGPAAGVILGAVGKVIGLEDATVDSVKEALSKNNLTGEQIAAIKELELEAKIKEKELGIRAEELAVQDRISARKSNVDGGVQNKLFILSLLLLTVTLGCEVWILLNGYPPELPEMIVGRVLGLMDALTMMVAVYWYGTNNSSAQKTLLLHNSTPNKV